MGIGLVQDRYRLSIGLRLVQATYKMGIGSVNDGHVLNEGVAYGHRPGMT